MRQLFIRLGYRRGGIYQKQHHISPPYAARGAGVSVEFHIAGHFTFFAHTRGVDGDKAAAVFFKPHIHRIPCCAGDLAGDDTLGADDGIEERAFAGIAFADEGQFHHGIFGAFGRQVIQPIDDLFH